VRNWRRPVAAARRQQDGFITCGQMARSTAARRAAAVPRVARDRLPNRFFDPSNARTVVGDLLRRLSTSGKDRTASFPALSRMSMKPTRRPRVKSGASREAGDRFPGGKRISEKSADRSPVRLRRNALRRTTSRSNDVVGRLDDLFADHRRSGNGVMSSYGLVIQNRATVER